MTRGRCGARRTGSPSQWPPGRDRLVYKPFTRFDHADFHLRITFEAEGNSSPDDRPVIDLTGSVSQSFQGTSDSLRLDGFLSARSTTAELHGWIPDSAIPRPLLDQFLCPGAVAVAGSVTGGIDNLLALNLHVAPLPAPVTPLPVPEPTALAAFVAALGLLGSRRHARLSPRD